MLAKRRGDPAGNGTVQIASSGSVPENDPTSSCERSCEISTATSLLQQGSTRPPQSQLRAIELGACGLAKHCQQALSRKLYRASSAGGQRAARRRSGNGRRDLSPAPYL